MPAVQLWLVTRYDDVRAVDSSPRSFTGATDPSTLNRTMGVNMLGSEGPHQQWVRASRGAAVPARATSRSGRRG